jgi:hypothetical protein
MYHGDDGEIFNESDMFKPSEIDADSFDMPESQSTLKM